MNERKGSVLTRLGDAGSPRDLPDWENHDGHYVTACRLSAEDVPELIDIANRWLEYLPGEDGEVARNIVDAELLPVTAWRALGDLRADEAVEPLIEVARAMSEEEDDWAWEELPHVFGKIGENAVDPLARVVRDPAEADYTRSIAARGLRYVADRCPRVRDRVVGCLTEVMADASAGHLEFNSLLLAELVELRAVEAAEAIERAFAADLLDVGMMGDWEEVRRDLGVEGLGLPMPENPCNSIDELRASIGVGIFSDQPIFVMGEIDHEGESAYYEKAREVFSNSAEAQQVMERYGDLGWFRLFLDFGIHYRGEVVDQMTLASVKEFVREFVPRKVSAEADSAGSIIAELTAFWQYLGRVYQLPHAESIVAWLGTDGRVEELEGELSDAGNFGMAKSMFMWGKRAGYDMTSESGVADFMNAYNEATTAEPAPPPPVSREQRVGRNDPCPCGSGKKFKKCCLKH